MLLSMFELLIGSELRMMWGLATRSGLTNQRYQHPLGALQKCSLGLSPDLLDQNLHLEKDPSGLPCTLKSQKL